MFNILFAFIKHIMTKKFWESLSRKQAAINVIIKVRFVPKVAVKFLTVAILLHYQLLV